MSNRNILWGLAAMVALFIVGSIVGGVWDDSDTAGAITVALWAISIIGAAVLIVLLVVNALRRRL